MKKTSNLYYVIFLSAVAIIFACNQSGDSKNNEETILKGTTNILVDETLKPIIEDQIEVFESRYDAKILIKAQSELEVINSLLIDSSRIAVLSRKLTSEEAALFEKKNIIPKTTKFAIDAIAFITNKNNKDTLIALQHVVDFMNGKTQAHIKGLVFDNPNSSTVRYMNELAGLKAIPETGVFSFKTNDEVIKFVSENDGMIGIVGVNWLSQPSPAMVNYVNSVNVLSVKNINGTGFFGPTQNNIAEGTYPLARDLYIINCQGFSGLGMGFSSFVAGDIGQRIILKSGLLPVRIPGRKLMIRNKIENKQE